MTPDTVPTESLKDEVRAFWDAESCGEMYARGDDLRAQLDSQAEARYVLEPYLPEFAKFSEGKGKDVLEVGVGMGADHLEWAKSGPRSLSGIDLTPRAVGITQSRLTAYGLPSNVQCGDAENLPFPDASFDLVYSWGVLHHSPNTQRAIEEVRRVLRPGGTARVMIYHRRSILGYMLWLRYGMMRFKGLDWVYSNYLESPGTKAYSVEDAKTLFANFSSANVSSCLAFGDLLQGSAGRRHRGPLLTVARAIWPRPLIKAFLPGHGMNLMIEARK